MITKCPGCSAKYKIDPSKLSSKAAKIRCKKCGTVFAVYENSVDVESKAPESKKKASVGGSNSTVFVCTTREEIYKAVSGKLGDSNVTKIADGVEALYKIITDKPSVVLIDVDLPRIYGFEITELVRRNDPDKEIFMVLLGSIYNKNAYKGDPNYAYGADKYIDHSDVVEKLDEILSGVSLSQKDTAEKSEKEVVKPSSPKPEEKPATPPSPPEPEKKESKEIDLDSLSPEDKAWVKKAERKARIIAADIALYNEEGLRVGLENGDVYERIAADLDAGTKHFVDNIPEHIRELKDFISVEVEKMLAKKREEFGL